MAERINRASLTLAFHKRINLELGVLNEKLGVQLRDDISKDVYTQNIIKEKENDLVEKLNQINKCCVDTPESDIYLTPEASPTDIHHIYHHSHHVRCASDSGISSLVNPPVCLHKTNTVYYSLVTVDEVFDSHTNEGVLEKELAEQDELLKSFRSIISKEGQKKKQSKPALLTLPCNQPSKNIKVCLGTRLNAPKASNCRDFKFDLNSALKEKYSLRHNQANKINSNCEEEAHSGPGASLSESPISSIPSSVENSKVFNNSRVFANNGNTGVLVDNAKCENMSKPQKTECDEVMSNPEIDVLGQDSCLEAGSSGYLTGSSPRDQTVSEIFGVDVTEVATSEDFPHDNDHSVRSSSVSSDAGTWDSTFPVTTEEITFKTEIDETANQAEDINQDLTHRPEENKKNDIQTSVTNSEDSKEIYTSISNNDYNTLLADYSSCSVLNRKEQYVPSNTDKTSKCSQTIFNDNSCEAEVGKKQCVDIAIENHYEKNNTSVGKNNFFIDASSLLDESEITVLPPKLQPLNKISDYGDPYNSSNSLGLYVSDAKEKKSEDLNKASSDEESNDDRFTKQLHNHKLEKIGVSENMSRECSKVWAVDFDRHETNNEEHVNFKNRVTDKEDTDNNSSTSENRTACNASISSCTFEISSTCKGNNKNDGEHSDENTKRPTLIRRNTFELEPDDEKLTKLRQEYEKSQGNGLFQNNLESQTSRNIYSFCVGSSSSHSKVPDSLCIVPKTSVVDDEIHSPDSLNNDGPVDSLFQNKANSDESLPFEKIFGSSSLKSNEFMENRKFNCIEDSMIVVENIEDGSHKNDLSEELENRDQLSSDSSTKSAIKSVFAADSFNERCDRGNRIESTPILSGGVSVNDYPLVTSDSDMSNSSVIPLHKTELMLTTSNNGSLTESLTVKPKVNTALTASWVVDMSDAVKSPPEVRRKKRSDSLLSSASSDHTEFDDNLSKSSARNSSSLGFFVSLDDPFDEKSSSESGYKSMTPQLARSTKIRENINNENKKIVPSNRNSSSFGFYIDLTESRGSDVTGKDISESKESVTSDNKLFSMFIDISDSSSNNVNKKSSPHLLSRKFRGKIDKNSAFIQCEEEKTVEKQSSEASIEHVNNSDLCKDDFLLPSGVTPPPTRQISCTEGSMTDLTNTNKKQGGFYMFIEAEPSPVPRRRTLPSGLRPNFQRHSWNPDSNNPDSQQNVQKKQHKRAHSVSIDKSLEVMFKENSEQTHSNSASLSKNLVGCLSGPSSMDENVSKYSEKKKIMMSSWHGSVKPSSELKKMIAKSEWKEMRESKSATGFLNRNDDSVSVSLRSDETFDISETSETVSDKNINNATFVINDVSSFAGATINDLDVSTPSNDVVSELPKDGNDTSTTDTENQKPSSVLKVVVSESTCVKKELHHSLHQSTSNCLSSVKEETKSSFVKLSDLDKEPVRVVCEEKRVVNRMSRSIPEASWIESKMMTRSATSRSLNRLFPHLNILGCNLTPEPGDQDTDVSEMSSMQSSMEPSALEGSTEETDASSCTSGPCSRLGEDLLRMFLDEISPDVTVEVGGRRIKAHKCILSSRCQYFAAMLSGGWVESAGNVISIQGFSYSAVHFALCHIYSGANNIPDSINIVELATLTDMLCLEGLKDVIMYTLKVKYCHFFHKPCSVCTVGVLECLPLAAAYGLDEIYRKSIRWITKYFVRIWPTKGFAMLPRELLDKCYKQHIVSMTVDNVLETVLCCSKLQSTIPNVRWAEPVFTLTSKLQESAIKFIAQNFCNVLTCEMFVGLGKEQTWNISRLEDALQTATERLPPEQACRSYSKLYNILSIANAPDPPLEMQWNQSFVDLLQRLSVCVENSLIKQAARAARSPAWTLMEPHLRHKIQDAACLVIVPGDDRRRARHSSLLRRSEVNSGLRSSSVNQAKVNFTQQSASGVAHKPASTNSVHTQAKPKPVLSSKDDESGTRPKTWSYKIPEVKSRYLEQRTPKPAVSTTSARDKPSASVPAVRRNVVKSIISSSDSSRTSSPAMRRSIGSRSSHTFTKKDQSAVSRRKDDVTTMSTDSLAETAMTKPSSNNISKTQPKVNDKKGISGEVNGARPVNRTPVLDRAQRAFQNRLDGIKVKSTESLTRYGQNDSRLKPQTVASQTTLNKTKSSPVPLSVKTSSQGSPKVKDSPVTGGRLKSSGNSLPSPSQRRSTVSPKTNTPEGKPTGLKRTSSYRVQPVIKATSPTKSCSVTKNTPTGSTARGNINKVQSKITNQNNKSLNNNKYTSSLKTADNKPQRTVGSRSGTFLKDEPTILKKT